MFSYAYKATLCRDLSLSFSFLFFHPLNPVHSLLLPHSVLCCFYPEAELGNCYNLTSTFLSPVTAAFARMHTGKAHVSFPPLLLFCLRQFLLIPRQSSRFFDRIMRRKRRQKKVKKVECCKRIDDVFHVSEGE